MRTQGGNRQHKMPGKEMRYIEYQRRGIVSVKNYRDVTRRRIKKVGEEVIRLGAEGRRASRRISEHKNFCRG